MLQVIRHYHGHLSAVYAMDLHPTIDVLVTCGRDATARVCVIMMMTLSYSCVTMMMTLIILSRVIMTMTLITHHVSP